MSDTTRQIKIKVKKVEPVAEPVAEVVADPSDKIAEAHFKLMEVVEKQKKSIAEWKEKCEALDATNTKQMDMLEEKCEALVNAGNQLEALEEKCLALEARCAEKEEALDAWVARYKEKEVAMDVWVGRTDALTKELADLKKQIADAGKREKHDNSPDLASGEVWRMVDGKKVKCKYVYPYKAEGGVSLVKTMAVGQKCVGVSTNQKGNTKDNIKVANYELEWLGLKTVRCVKTKTIYPHKDGKFSVVDGEDSFNVRMMVVSE